MIDKAPLSQLINLKGKTAIVTGGAMGIGFGIAYRLAEAGANVVIVDIDETVGNAATIGLRKNGWKVAFIKTDVSNENDVKAATDFAIATYGNIDILVNNAGIYPYISVMEMKAEMFDKVIDVNLKSVFLFTKKVSEIMIKQNKGGKIINITSIDALHPSAIGLAAYDATKHGIWGFTKNTALELAQYNISVNAIAPGGVATPGTGITDESIQTNEGVQKFIQKVPMKRIGEPDDIGKVALFLASDLSSYMTGSQIVVDGGVLLS